MLCTNITVFTICVATLVVYYTCLPYMLLCLLYMLLCLPYLLLCLPYLLLCLPYMLLYLPYMLLCLAYHICYYAYHICCYAYRICCYAYQRHWCDLVSIAAYTVLCFGSTMLLTVSIVTITTHGIIISSTIHHWLRETLGPYLTTTMWFDYHIFSLYLSIPILFLLSYPFQPLARSSSFQP